MEYIKHAQKVWNERLKQCIAERGLSQKGLADELNRMFKTDKFQQRSVSRWTRVGEIETTKKGEQNPIGFPKIETMLSLAEFFGKDVGYLLGETDIESDTLKGASDFTGLTQETVQTIRRYTHRRSCWFTVHLDEDEARLVFAYLLSSHSFREILHLLHELIEKNRGSEVLAKKWEEAEKEFGTELFYDALEHRDDFDPETPPPSPEYARAVRTINALIDDGAEDDDKRDIANSVYRYRLSQMFNKLLDEIVQQDTEAQQKKVASVDVSDSAGDNN